jgi:cation:H+ antiporter
MHYVALGAGLILLVIGADVLVKCAASLAARMHVPPLLIGLTIVAYGTSAPETVVSTMASARGQADIALGNVLGSNIFNVLLILGASACVTPLLISARLVRIDVPVMVGFSLLTWALASEGVLTHADGVLLLTALAIYTAFQVAQARRATNTDIAAPPRGHVIIDIVLLIGGFGLLLLGSRWFLDGTVAIARMLGVSELVIGLTIVAAGTSLPELATSIVAALRGARDIAIGNVVGSNVFNLTGVLGVACLVSDDGVSVATSSLHFDVPIMVAVAFACLPIFFKDNIIARWQGCVFVGYYVCYVIYLILDAQGHDAIDLYGRTMVYFAFPITALTFGTIALRRFREHSRRRGPPA